jgi:2-keto-4-pentenoate hydratase/2-oxohepta-3-ene-1,7-dioic acid hydratase in catechol pathway
MRFANVSGRLSLLVDGTAVDVAEASAGRFGPDPQSVWSAWDAFVEWEAGVGRTSGSPFSPEQLGPPVPRPRQLFAIGLNYRDHAEEANLALPENPVVFTKFPSALTGPYGEIRLPTEYVDWEVELVLVIGREAHQVSATDGWRHVAGVCVGQDLSERQVQNRPPAAQFSLGKSFPGFAPLGPAVVTVDELANPDKLEIGCRLNGREMQIGRTSDMIFPVGELVAELSGIVTLLPGDLIYTGTPAGVGIGRTPPQFLRPGDVLESYIAGVGELRHVFVDGSGLR